MTKRARYVCIDDIYSAVIEVFFTDQIKLNWQISKPNKKDERIIYITFRNNKPHIFMKHCI